MRYVCIALVSWLFSSCGNPSGLQVKQYHLRESMFGENGDPMARGEVQRLLHGSISVAEQRQKVGQYYRARWTQPDANHSQPVRFTFEYQQAATVSKVLRITKDVPNGRSCEAEFSVIGDDYAKHGRVLAWCLTVSQNGQTLASKQSYMWQKNNHASR